MGTTDPILRNSADDSDAYVTFDLRSVILDLPDDGRVADLLPGRAARAGSAPSAPRPSALRARTL